MSGEAIYDIYEDSGFDADGLEANNIYDEIEQPKQPQSVASAPEVEVASKPVEIKKETKVSSAIKSEDTINSPSTAKPFLEASPKSQVKSLQGASLAIHVINLPWWTSEDDLRSRLSTYVSPKDIAHVVFQEYKVNGKSRGVAYIEFKELSASAKAREALDNQIFEDRHCSTCYTQVTPTPFQRIHNPNPRQIINGHEMHTQFAAPGTRMRGRSFNHRSGNYSNSILDMNQPVQPSLPNSILNGGFPNSVSYSQNYPGIWGQPSPSGMPISGISTSQGYTSRNPSRSHNFSTGYHSTVNKRPSGTDFSSRTSRRRYD